MPCQSTDFYALLWLTHRLLRTEIRLRKSRLFSPNLPLRNSIKILCFLVWFSLSKLECSFSNCVLNSIPDKEKFMHTQKDPMSDKTIFMLKAIMCPYVVVGPGQIFLSRVNFLWLGLGKVSHLWFGFEFGKFP